MSDVVSFPSKVVPDTLWVCGCGCASFALNGEGDLTCSACKCHIGGDAGGWFVPPLPDTVWEGPSPVNHITSNGSPEFARRRMSTFAGEPDVAGIVIIRKSGAIHAWTDVDTAKGVAWLQERMKDAAEIIIIGAVDE